MGHCPWGHLCPPHGSFMPAYKGLCWLPCGRCAFSCTSQHRGAHTQAVCASTRLAVPEPSCCASAVGPTVRSLGVAVTTQPGRFWFPGCTLGCPPGKLSHMCTGAAAQIGWQYGAHHPHTTRSVPPWPPVHSRLYWRPQPLGEYDCKTTVFFAVVNVYHKGCICAFAAYVGSILPRSARMSLHCLATLKGVTPI